MEQLEEVRAFTAEQKARKAPEGRVYLALCLHYWGKGATVREALQQMERAGAHRPKEVLVKNAPADAYVDDYGSVCWLSPDPANPVEPAYTVIRKGFPKAKAAR